MQKINFYSEKIEKQYQRPLLSANQQQLIDLQINRLAAQSEPRFRTNQHDGNIYFDQMPLWANSQARKENVLVLKSNQNEFCEFPIYSDSKLGVNEFFHRFKDLQFDYDIETTYSEVDEGMKEGVSDLNYAIRKYKYKKPASLQNKPQQGLMEDDKN